ncbi:MAG: hypothetical protein OEZ06_04655 [Myxococcales bacterium]|nr:hypothetical protein [Myxococcales bacterium]
MPSPNSSAGSTPASPPAHFWRYVRIYCGLFLLVWGLVAVGNAVVDPYLVFDSPDIQGVNAIRTEFVTHLRLGKAHAVRRQQPRNLILGSSSAEYGFDPEHPAFGAEPTYNLGLSGVNMYELLRFFQHAHAIRPLRKVVVEVQLYMFNARRPPRPDFDEERLAAGPEGDRRIVASPRDVMQALFSFQAVASSIKTVRSQGKRPHYRYLANGQRHPTWNAPNIQRKGGHRKVFRARERSFLERRALALGYEFSFQDSATGRSTFDELAQLLSQAHASKMELYLLVSPSHAREWEAMREAGLWEHVERWKRELVRVNTEVADRAGKQAFPLWDFGVYHAISCEAVPVEGDAKSLMRWYWDDAHYRKELGDIVLDRITGRRSSEPSAHAFGAKIGEADLEGHLARVRKAAAAYRKRHPRDVGELRRTMHRLQRQNSR